MQPLFDGEHRRNITISKGKIMRFVYAAMAVVLLTGVGSKPSGADALGHGVEPNPTTIPTDGDPGRSDLAVVPLEGTVKPEAADGNTFRTKCEFSHMAQDDPLLNPNQPGQANHLHVFFGNKLTSAASTPESIATTGASTCRGGIANRSAYWVPAMVDKDGTVIRPTFMFAYYKNHGHSPAEFSKIQAFPPRLRMIAGGAVGNGSGTSIGCHDPSPGISTNTLNSDLCQNQKTLRLEVNFPQCWNGRDLGDTAGRFRDHMAYSNADKCPDSHPVSVPQLGIIVNYDIAGKDLTTLGWHLDGDSTGAPGHSFHADYMNGWDQPIAERWVENCNRPDVDCGVGNIDGRLPNPQMLGFTHAEGGRDAGTPAPTPTPVPSPAQFTWSVVATEGAGISFPDGARRNLRFGVEGKWHYKSTYNDNVGVSCTSAWFDGVDPAVGVVKTCELYNT
jgi:Domain of unknown function (DUF1996)